MIRWAMPRTAHRTASTTLLNSASIPSPVLIKAGQPAVARQHRPPRRNLRLRFIDAASIAAAAVATADAGA